MGPRSWDRGERWATAIRPASPAMLQWGRGLGTAESSRLLLKRAEAETLQWGRGLGTAESAMPRASVRACESLQWGRGLGTAESRTRSAFIAAERMASMGPRSWDRGEVRGQN